VESFFNGMENKLKDKALKGDANLMVDESGISVSESALDFNKGVELINKKRWREAEECFLQAISINDRVAEYFNKLAISFYHQNKIEEEIDSLIKAIDLDDRHASWFGRLGDAFIKKANKSAAEEAFINAWKRNDSVDEYINKIVDVLRSQGKWEGNNTENINYPINFYLDLGKRLLANERWNDAEIAFRHAIAINNASADIYMQLAELLYAQKKSEETIEILNLVMALDNVSHDCYLRVATLFKELKKWSESENAYRKLIEHDNSQAEFFNQLAFMLRKQGKWWQEVEALKSAIALDSRHATWYFRLGEAHEAMNQFVEAVVSYKKAISLKDEDPNWYFQLGYCLEKSEQSVKADSAYAEAIKRDPTKLSQQFGIGVYHQNRQHWHAAAKSYAEKTKSVLFNAELFYRLGMAYDRCYEWKKAEKAYISALSINMSDNEWHYRLGFVRERMQKWHEAALAYNFAVTNSERHVPYWFYRLGYVLTKNGDYEKACKAFLKTQKDKSLSKLSSDQELGLKTEITTLLDEVEQTQVSSLHRLLPPYLETFSKAGIIRDFLENDSTHPDYFYQLGNEYEREEEYEKAIGAYRAAVARKDEHSPFWYYRLGFSLVQLGRYQDACEAFLETQILKKPYGASRSLYNKSESFKKVVDYTEYFESLEVEEKTILYESYHGVSMSCNPYAIFLHLLERPEFNEWTHVWVINDKTKIPTKFRANPNIAFVKRDSHLYRKYLCSTKYLINNSTFPAYFIRKQDQVYLNTWHGTPLKTMGKDIKTTFMEHANTAKNFLHTTHLLSPNPHTTYALVDQYDISGSYRGVIAESGYPRIDLTLNATEEDVSQLREFLGIADGKKVVLYAPTWRGTLGSAERYDIDKLISDIKSIEEKSDCHVLFRGHYFVESVLQESSVGAATVVPEDLDTNTLLSIVDVLVTDYSSIAFDFFATGKPVIYYIYDLDDYKNDRGLYFSMEDMPGQKCFTSEELFVAVNDAIEMPVLDNRYKSAQNRFCPYEDGDVTRKVVDLVFFGDKNSIYVKKPDNRTSLLLFGGVFQPNGILTSFLNLLNAIDKKEYSKTIAIDPSQVSLLPERLQQFNRLPDDVQVIGRAGRMDMTLEEKFVIDTFNRQNYLDSDEMKKIYNQVFQREYLRMFGYAHYDSVIQFEGYSRFWLSVFACSTKTPTTKKVTYLHNNMMGEWIVRFPILESIFNIYPSYDSLISVSKLTSDLNSENLSARFDLDENLFVYCDNLQNPQQTLELAEEPLAEDALSLFEKRNSTFLTIGRLSPEKDHEKLIYAFASLVINHPDARLLIIGEGPLRHHLVNIVKDLGLTEHVYLLGQLLNPFPYLKKADCFILPSNHEGQPMVLFEAMILNKPIIATDIVGSRSVLQGQYGLLVDNTKEGLIDGMSQFIEGRLNTESFDIVNYQENAINMFYDAIRK
jgi:CDP-glycerol glycerophosphotransferase